MIRELAPWEIPVSASLDRPDPFLGMAMAALAAGSLGLPLSGRREPARRVLRIKPKEPRAKRIRKAQRAARKARRRAEAG